MCQVGIFRDVKRSLFSSMPTVVTAKTWRWPDIIKKMRKVGRIMKGNEAWYAMEAVRAEMYRLNLRVWRNIDTVVPQQPARKTA